MILETERLYLREMNSSDYRALKKILQDEETMYAYNGAFDNTETFYWLNKQIERYKEYGFGLWAVILKETDEMIGQCGLTMQNWKDRQLLEIGYLFQRAYWHKGYATEAAAACKEYAFTKLNAGEVFSIIRDTNTASQNVALRNGMTKTDTWTKHYRGIDMPHYLYSVKKVKEDLKMSGRTEKETEGISLLGNQKTKYPTDYAPEVLETFINKHQENDYFVKFNCPEFTSLCPITGQPDFAAVYISYVPAERMVESKSLKLYLYSFRNHGDFHEDCMNIIMKDLIKLMDPKYIEVWGKFTPRGGISIDPYCNYGKKGTMWEQVAVERLTHHDLYPEKIDNR